MRAVLGIEAGHIYLLNFTEALYPLEKCCPAFHNCSLLKQCLFLLALDLETKGLPI